MARATRPAAIFIDLDGTTTCRDGTLNISNEQWDTIHFELLEQGHSVCWLTSRIVDVPLYQAFLLHSILSELKKHFYDIAANSDEWFTHIERRHAEKTTQTEIVVIEACLEIITKIGTAEINYEWICNAADVAEKILNLTSVITQKYSNGYRTTTHDITQLFISAEETVSTLAITSEIIESLIRSRLDERAIGLAPFNPYLESTEDTSDMVKIMQRTGMPGHASLICTNGLPKVTAIRGALFGTATLTDISQTSIPSEATPVLLIDDCAERLEEIHTLRAHYPEWLIVAQAAPKELDNPKVPQELRELTFMDILNKGLAAIGVSLTASSSIEYLASNPCGLFSADVSSSTTSTTRRISASATPVDSNTHYDRGDINGAVLSASYTTAPSATRRY